MKQQLVLEKKLRNKFHKKDKAQARFLSLSASEEAKNNESNLKPNSLEVNELVKLFDCSGIVFKYWNFYEDSFYQTVLFPDSKLERGLIIAYFNYWFV